MKNLIYIFILFFFHFGIMLYAQNSESIFTDAHGVNLGYGVEYNIEGYLIYDRFEKIKSGEKGISQVKRKFSLNKDITPYINPKIKSEHQLLVNKVTREGNLIETTICYIFPHDYGLSRILFFNTNIDRNIELENTFVNYFIGDSIPNYVENSSKIDSIDFVGRTIKLGDNCNWRGAHNIQCPNYGQMDWAIFKDKKSAQDYLNNRKLLISKKWLVNIESEKEVNVLFEGIETKAMKIVIQITIPKIAMGGSNKLVIYFVSEKIRNKYVSCVMSHYTDDVSINGTSPLINELIQLVND